MKDVILDVRAVKCPLPVILAGRKLKKLPPDTRLRVLLCDSASLKDFQIFCRENSFAILVQSEETGFFNLLISQAITATQKVNERKR